MNQGAQQNLRAFLLGRLDASEADELSLSLIEDVQLFEEAERLEAELADAFVREELSDSDKRAFELRLATSPRLRERTSFARTLANHLDTRRQAQEPPSRRGGSPLGLVGGFSSSTQWKLAAALLLALALLAWWTSVRNPSPSPLTPQTLQANKPNPGNSGSGLGTVGSMTSNLPSFPWTLALATMGPESIPLIPFDPQTYGSLALKLDLNIELPDRQVRVRLLDGNHELIRRAAQTALRDGSAVVYLEVSSDLLRPPTSAFVAEVTDLSSGKEELLGHYEFRVKSKPS